MNENLRRKIKKPNQGDSGSSASSANAESTAIAKDASKAVSGSTAFSYSVSIPKILSIEDLNKPVLISTASSTSNAVAT